MKNQSSYRNFKPVLKPDEAKKKFYSSSNLARSYVVRHFDMSAKLLKYGEERILSVQGCGFDRNGTAFGDLFEMEFYDLLPKLFKKAGISRSNGNYQSSNFPGLVRFKVDNKKTGKKEWKYHVDGGVGIREIQNLFHLVGFNLYGVFFKSGRDSHYILEFNEKWESIEIYVGR